LKQLLTLTMGFAALLSSAVLAQSWIFFAPPERDFRVLFPGSPTRLDTPSGSVEFRTDTGTYQYSVFRHDPRRISSIAAWRDDIVQRSSNDDQYAAEQDDRDLGPNEFIFRTGMTWTLHRLVLETGRSYELVVKAGPDDGIPRQAARDFFNSFQMRGASGFPVFTNLPAPDSCQARDNAFARRFCEYLTCQAAGYENHPACAGIPRFLKN